MNKALDDIAAERRRQIEAEGWTPEHDDAHTEGDLAKAAACYALSDPGVAIKGEPIWPWWNKDTGPECRIPVVTGRAWWKPKDRRRDLVRAAALMIAEIERLDRASEQSS